ncbi:hypothetical protein AALP_AA2G189500 [Arabis alpina]|uniref:RING-type domain-containing protein n=1 Tax=Arabis alpina TaxID=50452 RepID=A0A087HIH1_ARAAL|nr:hypothetical protein AALP_AA2G189500 [Arabis alpina]
MVADSITGSELFHGSPISRDFVKKRKGNWFCKLKQWKIDARRKQWIYQWKRANVDKLTDRRTGSYCQGCRIDNEEGSYKFTECDDDDDEEEIDLEEETMSASSPTSVLKNKDDSGINNDDDCFCCSKKMTEEEEEDYDDAFENWEDFSDALNSFENEGKKERRRVLKQEEASPKLNTNQRRRRKSSPAKVFHKDNYSKPPEKASNKNKNRRKKKKFVEKEDCPICSEEMDATDLSFLPCPCGFQLCLFCHKQITENDGRCPACREKYGQPSSNNGQVSFQQRGRGTIRLSPSFRGLDRA